MGKEFTLLFAGAHPDDETFGVGATLSHYAAAGVLVHYLCATRGEAGLAAPEHMNGYATPGDMRWAELKCASQALGLAGVVHLGYRDSGMPGSEDNKHPQALVSAPLDQVVGRIVSVIRELRPQVVITFDPIGGYRHPDHIAMHNATVRAFHAAADPGQYPEAGPAFHPQKLYFHVFPRRLLRLTVRLLPLFGQDPHRLGSNRDIDMASLAAVNFPVDAVITVSKHAAAARDRATACYVSQLGGSPRRAGIFSFIQRFAGRSDLYMRDHPPADHRGRENDLFAGIV